MVDVISNLKRVRREIKSIALGCDRDPSQIQLLAVTKTVSAELVEAACAAGQLLYGENRVQEAGEKIPSIRGQDLEWHLIGPLQSNKARRAVELFDVIETLDRTKIVHRVNQCAEEMNKTLPVFIEVNIGEEPQKHGALPARLVGLMELVDQMSHLELRGLMTIPPYQEDPEASRAYFKKMSHLLEELNRVRAHPLHELSMGMTHDYRIAIEEGATLLRVGTAIFGRRPL